MTLVAAAIRQCIEENIRRTEADTGVAPLRRLHRLLNAKIDEKMHIVLNKRTAIEWSGGFRHEVVRVDATRQEWEAVFISILIGSDLINTAIASGLYLQAICLVRQELEGLAQLRHVLQGSRKATHSPNLSVLDSSIKRWYGALSDGAHLASHEMVGVSAPPDPIMRQSFVAVLPHGTAVMPVYNRVVAREILKLNFRVRIRLFRELRSYVSELQLEPGF